MRKIVAAALAVLGIISATGTFANNANGAEGKKFSVMSTRLNHNQMKLHLMDITILNRSDNDIWVRNLPYVNDFIESGANDRLISERTDGVFIQLINNYNNTLFFDQYVCNRAVVTVKGRGNGLVAYLDNSQCY